MPEVTVFDFDETLTTHDTVFGFFRCCGRRRRWFGLRLLVYGVLMVTTKARLIRIDTLKRAGIALFMRGMNETEVKSCARAYAGTIRRSEVFQREFPTEKRKVVVSASFRECVEAVVGDVPVIASELEWAAGRVVGMKVHCHGARKVSLLRERFPGTLIRAVYTDSFADRPLMELANEVFWVKQGVAQRFVVPPRGSA